MTTPALKKIVIFGVGLIGGSFARALKHAGAVTTVVGMGRSPASMARALELGIIDEIGGDMATAIAGADLVLLAAPVAQTGAILASIAPHLQPGTVVTDAGSTKSDVVAAARAALGGKAGQFVPGHPIAGRETNGPDAAIIDLYQGKKVVLTPLAENSAADVVDQRKGQQMRQMADGGKYLVMFFGCQCVQDGTAGAPRGRHPFHVSRSVFRQRCEHHFLALIQIDDGRVRPVRLASRDRVAGHELRHLATERRARGRHHVAFRAARIGDDGAGLQMRRDGRQNSARLRHGRGDQHQVGAKQGIGHVAADRVDDAQFQRARQRGRRAAHADHGLNRARVFQGARERAADQAHAEDDDFVQCRRRHIVRPALSSARR